MNPLFLTLDEAIRLHKSQIDLFGGSHGLRDAGLLESALAQPRQAFGGQFLHPDVAGMAAAYLFHIVQNHPFIDGNKRTGSATAIVFLKMNSIRLIADEMALTELVLAVAAGRAPKEAVAAYFRDHIT